MARTSYRAEIKTIEELSGARKAAVLFVALNQEIAAKILKHLDRDRVEEITREIAAIEAVVPEVREEVIREFHNLVMARQYTDAGGMPWARTLLMKTLPPEEARRVISVIEHQVHEQPFSFLQKTEKENLVTFLQEEHPQTIAMVLSHLPPGMATDILSALPTARQIEVVSRVAKMDQTSPDVIKEVERGWRSGWRAWSRSGSSGWAA